jgi:hypothetical protein
MLADRHGDSAAQAETPRRDVGDRYVMLDALRGHQLRIMRDLDTLPP